MTISLNKYLSHKGGGGGISRVSKDATREVGVQRIGVVTKISGDHATLSVNDVEYYLNSKEVTNVPQGPRLVMGRSYQFYTVVTKSGKSRPEAQNVLLLDRAGFPVSSTIVVGEAKLLGLLQSAATEKSLPGNIQFAECKWFSPQRGIGFLNTIPPRTDGADVMVHHQTIQQEGYKNLTRGEYVAYTLEDPRGSKADSVWHLEVVLV